jgi:glycerophosphoryl diester phosphodiesterase
MAAAKAKGRSLLLEDGSRPLLFGHRGYSAIAPENTLAAFQALLEHGIPGAELDVQLSRDGRLMVIHDFNLQRVTGLDAAVRESDSSAIRALDAGSWVAPQFRGQRVPLLEEVLASCGERLYYDIELKWDRKEANGLEEAVVACLRRHGLQRRCLLSSFNPYCIARLRRLTPQLPTAHIWTDSRELPFLLRHGEAGLLLPTPFIKPEAGRISPLRALTYRLLGSRMLAWTVDDGEEARRLLRLGVRGFISNDPGGLRGELRGAGLAGL